MYQSKLARLFAFLVVLVFVILVFSVIFFKEEQLMAVMHKIADVYGPNVNKDSFPASDGDELKKNPVAKVKEECTLGRSKFEFIFFDLVILKYIFKKFKKNT